MVQVNTHPGDIIIAGETVTMNGVGGNITLSTVCGDEEVEGLIGINSTNFIGLNCCNAFIEMNNQTLGGSINIQTQNAGLIQVNASTTEINSAILVSPEFIQIFNGIPGICSAIQLTQESMLLSIGETGVGASITLTPESIIFKVGETMMTISAEGIVTECGDTMIEVSPEGINEETGDVTREMNAEGHNFTAAETEMNVGVAGLECEGATFSGEFEGSMVQNATVNESSFDATSESESAMTMIL